MAEDDDWKKKTLRQMDGFGADSSGIGSGYSFVFMLPAVEVAGDDAPPPPPPVTSEAPAAGQRGAQAPVASVMATLSGLGWAQSVSPQSRHLGAWRPERTRLEAPVPAVVDAGPYARVDATIEMQGVQLPTEPFRPAPLHMSPPAVAPSPAAPYSAERPAPMAPLFGIAPSAPLGETREPAAEPEPPPGIDEDTELGVASVREMLADRGAPPELLAQLDALADAEPAEPPTPPSPDELRAMFTQEGKPPPEGLEQMIAALEGADDEEDGPDPAAPDPLTDRQRVEKAKQAGESCAGWTLIEADLSGLDLRGMDFTDAVLRGADLRGVNLDEAVLTGAVLVEATLDDAQVSRANLARADLSGARGVRVSFEVSLFEDTIMREGSFPGASFQGAVGPRFDAVGSHFNAATFEGARLDRADLSQTELEGAVFDRASLVDCSIEGAFALDARFDEANVEKLRAEGANLTGSKFRKVKASGARFPDARLTRANFGLSTLDGSDFERASLAMASLGSCVLTGARFDGADLSEANLLASDLMHARFEGANLDDADLRSSNLYGAETWKASTVGTRLEGAILTGTKLESR